MRDTRQTYMSMVNLLDTSIGNLTQQLKDKGFWDNTVLVFSSDSARKDLYI